MVGVTAEIKCTACDVGESFITAVQEDDLELYLESRRQELAELHACTGGTAAHLVHKCAEHANCRRVYVRSLLAHRDRDSGTNLKRFA